ncbi:hypothetical protein S40293_09646 [Stachybotrys chartarum IBT 40293]|nr:hypothetical protein S40293_09646 [Stachybotrys chartarum IBT 40293]
MKRHTAGSHSHYVSKRARQGADSDGTPGDTTARGSYGADSRKAAFTETDSIQKPDSVRKQAEPYRLAVAILPIDLLNQSWSQGSNRDLDRNRVAHLCRSFSEGSLARRAEENYIRVSCSAAAVGNMLRAIGSSPESNQSVLSFRHWAQFNEERPEIMSGQHRIEALREYVKKTGSSPDELWWVCKTYDKDTLPIDLDIKLRVNRQDLALPDSHGQHWMQLVLASDRDPTIFSPQKCRNKQSLGKKMLDILCLQSETRFPISRLTTLWRKHRWMPMITEWCKTSFGRSLFNITTWDRIASYRLDDYWFDTFSRVLETLATFSDCAASSMQTSDWAVLAGSLGNNGYTAVQARQVFYPVQDSNDDAATEGEAIHPVDEPSMETIRRKGFFSLLEKQEYHDLYQHIRQGCLTLQFPDVLPILRIRKDEGEIMVQVVDHVVRWINPEPVDIVDRQENNKPLRRQDFVPALQELLEDTHGPDWWAQLRNTEASDSSDIASFLDERSRSLERHYLNMMPEEHDASYASYTERFDADDLWVGLFKTVQSTIGPAFRPVWQEEQSGQAHGAGALHHKNNDTRRRPVSAVTRAVCSQLRNIPEVTRSPALNSARAFAKLGATIDRAVITRIDNRLNIFEGLSRNYLFMVMFVIMFAVRLNGRQWGISLILGFLSIPLGILIRLFPDSVIRVCARYVARCWPIPQIRRRKRDRASPAHSNGEIATALTTIRGDLQFLKRVRGGRINLVGEAIVHPVKVARRSHSRNGRGALWVSPTKSAMDSAFAVPGILAASVSGLLPVKSH